MLISVDPVLFAGFWHLENSTINGDELAMAPGASNQWMNNQFRCAELCRQTSRCGGYTFTVHTDTNITGQCTLRSEAVVDKYLLGILNTTGDPSHQSAVLLSTVARLPEPLPRTPICSDPPREYRLPAARTPPVNGCGGQGRTATCPRCVCPCSRTFCHLLQTGGVQLHDALRLQGVSILQHRPDGRAREARPYPHQRR